MPPTLIPSSLPPRTRVAGNATIYIEPRISANQLALFCVSDPSKQETIVRHAKRVLAVRVANYNHARAAVARCHGADGLDMIRLAAEVSRMESREIPDEYDNKCNTLSVAVLRKLMEITQEIDCGGAQIQRPSRGFDNMLIAGVRVSVQPDIVYSFQHRGLTKFGGVMFNFSKTEPMDRGTSGNRVAGDYAAFLVFQMLGILFGPQGGARYQNCFAVDVHRGDIYRAPSAGVTMQRTLEASCRAIARQWDEVPLDEFDVDLF